MNEFWANLPVILIFLAMAFLFGSAFLMLLRMPREMQMQALKEWLKFAVSIAEKELGSGTGQLKLREVYDQALALFPSLMKKIPFEAFSNYVDEALQWMRKEMEKNAKIKEYINNESD